MRVTPRPCPLTAAPSLVVFGVEDDVRVVVTFAKTLGWDVTVAGSDPGRALPHRFPDADRVVLTSPDDPLAGVPLHADSAAVLMTHSLALDRAVLRALRSRPLPYLGILGPRQRADRLLAEVFDDDIAGLARMRARIHSPIGLDIGADGPAETALAIVAEIRAALASRPGGYLKRRVRPLQIAQPSLPAAAPRNGLTSLFRRAATGGRA